MKQDAYDRNITARAFDVARYVLFFGIPTGVGQVGTPVSALWSARSAA